MKETNHSKGYTAADIERYLNGQMTAPEMHAMESAALEDPMLADAIEGYDTLNTTDTKASVQQDIDELATRLEDRLREKRKIIPFGMSDWRRIAAAVFIISGTALLTYFLSNLTNSDGNNQLAKNESVVALKHDSVQQGNGAVDSTAYTTPAATASGDAVVEHQQTGKSNNRNKEEKLQQEIAKASVPTVTDRAETTPPLSAAEKENAAQKDVAGNITNVQPAARAASPMIAKKQIENANAQASMNREAVPFAANRFGGVVVDQENKPIEGASVVIQNKNVGVSTDKDGNFNVLMPDSAIKISIASVGFETANLTLKNNLVDNRIVLKPNSGALDEVVVVGYGTGRRTQSKVSQKAKVNGEPVIGWDAFTAYLEENKTVATTDTSVHGVVFISFLVDKTGKPTSLQVQQSLSSTLDEEAKRLIIHGPSWKPMKGKTRAVAAIRF